MKEIITIQIGECGNTLADSFWDNLYSEHILSYEKPLFSQISHDEYPDAYLKETSLNNCIPRTIIIDTDPHIKSHYINNILINSDTEGNWAKAYLELGPNLNSNLEDIFQKEAEYADFLQGFQIFHSLGGGLGSGITSHIIRNLKDTYSHNYINTFSVVPSEKLSKMPSETYNACLALDGLIENADIVTLLDNQGLYRLCQEDLGISQPFFTDLNSIINPLVSAFTCINRYKGNYLTNTKKLLNYYTPYPRMHFFVPSIYPIIPNKEIIPENILIDKITQNRNFVTDVPNDVKKNLGYFLITRGANSIPDLKNSIQSAFDSRKIVLKEWIPDSFNHENYLVSYRNMDNYGALFANNENSCNIIGRISFQFDNFLSKKIWVDKYLAFGFDDMDFTEILCNVNDLCTEYAFYN